MKMINQIAACVVIAFLAVVAVNPQVVLAAHAGESVVNTCQNSVAPALVPPHLVPTKNVSNTIISIKDSGSSDEIDSVTLRVEAEGNRTGNYTPVDVVLVIDSSGSMVGLKGSYLCMAVNNFIDCMRSQDRCAIYIFQGGGPEMIMPFTLCNPAGKYALKCALACPTPGCGTPLWDTIGAAMTYLVCNPGRGTSVLIAFTDGYDDILTVSGDEETASSQYCPGAPSLPTPNMTWASQPDPVKGNVWSNMSTYNGVQRAYNNSGSLTNLTWVQSTRMGLIHPPVLAYTIGLELIPTSYNTTNTTYLSSSRPAYKYTTEYDLRQIAETTSAGNLTGKYFYANDPNDLLGIYKNLADTLFYDNPERAAFPQTNESMIVDVLPPYVQVLPNPTPPFGNWSYTPNSTVFASDSSNVIGKGGLMEFRWNVSRFFLGDVFEIQYRICSTMLGWQSIGVSSANASVNNSNYCKITYENWCYSSTHNSTDIWTNETNDVSIYVKDKAIPELVVMAFFPLFTMIAIYIAAGRARKKK